MFFNSPFQKQKVRQQLDELRQLQQDMGLATEMIKQASQNNFSAFDKSDQFQQALELKDALQEMRAQIMAYRQSEQERKWVMLGESKFSELTRQNLPGLEELSGVVLNFLIQYLEIQQGGLFLYRELSEKEAYLDLIACYAYNRKKFLQKEILIQDGFAEGLIGEVFTERKIVHLDKVPPGYLSIDSGLGDASPNQVLLFPLYTQEKGIGVIELATFHAFEPHHIELIQNLAENISAAIAQVQSTVLMRKFLQETQEQAEQIVAQEEFVRQTNEELMATQEEMLRSSQDMKLVEMAIKHSGLLRAEFEPQGRLRQANEAFNSLWGARSEQTKYETWGDFFPEIASQLEATFSQRQDERVLTWSGEFKTYLSPQVIEHLKGTFCYMPGEGKEEAKVILLAYEYSLRDQLARLEEKYKQALSAKQSEIASMEKDLKLAQKELGEKSQQILHMKQEEGENKAQDATLSKEKVATLLEKYKIQEDKLRAQLAEKEKLIEQIQKENHSNN